MSTILFKDHGAYLVRDNWDGDEQKYHYDEEKISTLAPYLGSYVEVGRNFLFGDLIALIEKDADFFDQVFHCALGKYPLSAFLEEARKEPKKKDKIAGPDEDGICYLFVSHVCQHDVYSDGEHDLHYYCDFHGWGYQVLGENTGARKEDYGKIQHTTYSLSFSPLNELLHYPFKLDEKMKIEFCDMSKGKYKRETIPVGNHGFSLYEVLDAILDDISFHGVPEKRDEVSCDLMETIEETKLHPEDLIPWEDVKKDLKKSSKERKKKNKEEAPELIAQYEKLLQEHKDPEKIEVKRFYMENRGNKQFKKGTAEMNEIAEKAFIEKI